jgi:hypothetical protein
MSVDQVLSQLGRFRGLEDARGEKKRVREKKSQNSEMEDIVVTSSSLFILVVETFAFEIAPSSL